MAWAPDYLTASEFKAASAIGDTVDDAEISLAISAASRAIDAFTGRQFGNVSSAVPRYYASYYDANRRTYITVIDDLQTTTSLVVKTNNEVGGTYDNTLVLDTDFVLRPINAAADGRPWTMIEGVSGSAYTLPGRAGGIEITGKWGWTAVPAQVKQACLLQALRLFKDRTAPFGVAGSPEMGNEVRLLAKVHPDVQVLLTPLVRMWGAR